MNIRIEHVTKEDAKLILDLRLDPKCKYLSPTINDLKIQEDFIIFDALKGNLYFKFFLDDLFLGVYRVYKNKYGMWEYGSFIIANNTHSKASILMHTALLDRMFKHNSISIMCHTCDKDNQKIIKFHERLGTKFVGYTEDGYRFYIATRDWWATHPLSESRIDFVEKFKLFKN